MNLTDKLIKILYEDEYIKVLLYKHTKLIEFLHKKHIPQKIYEELFKKTNLFYKKYNCKKLAVQIGDRRVEYDL